MFKTLSRSIRENLKPTILTILAIVVEVIAEVFIPLIMAELIDKGIYAGQMPEVYKFGAWLLFFSTIQLITGLFAAYTSSKASTGFAFNLRHDLFEKIQEFSFNNIDKFQTSSLVTRITNDVSNVQNSFLMIIRMAVRAPFMAIFSLISAIIISPKISSVFLLIIPLMGIAMFIITKIVLPYFVKIFKEYDKLNMVVQENVKASRVVKTFNAQDREISKFQKVSLDIMNHYLKAEKTIAFSSPIMNLLLGFTLILISWLGAKEILASGNNADLGLTTGELTALFTYSFQILFSLIMVTMVSAILIISSASAKRLCEILEEESDIISPANSVKEMENGDIDFINVSFAYNKNAEQPVLSNINLSIKSGEFVGIIGATGSAKSSLVQLIPRLYDVTHGSLKVSGVDVRDYDLNILRDGVAMVLQKNELFSGTIADNLRFGNLEATITEMKEACRLASIDEFIESLPEQYNAAVEQGGVNFSGGQKQRICIARALLKKPKVLILDDSTSAVDTRTDMKIQRSFKEYLPETTKIVIAQRISSIQNADKILVLSEGKISAVGTHDELIADNEIYREIFESQQKE